MNKIISKAPKILMCRPTYYTVEYSINPWMDLKNGVDHEKAMTQWTNLKKTIESKGATVEVMEPNGAHFLPDLVFTANAAVVRGNVAYLANFRHRERKEEYKHYGNWLRSNGYYTEYNPEIVHEGTGDALWAGKGSATLFSGVGPRSDERAIDDLRKKLSTEKDSIDVKPVRLVDPRFYHLDTCFCPLDEEVALYFPSAFDEKSISTLKKTVELLPVDEKEACQFACNAVVVGKNVIMHKGSEQTAKMLEKHGYSVNFVNMSEFLKSGGSAKCCTLRIE